MSTRTLTLTALLTAMLCFTGGHAIKSRLKKAGLI